MKTCLLLLLIIISSAFGNAQSLRAPSYPLITHDPYFSVWSFGGNLTDYKTKHWTGRDQALTGIIKVDGESYQFIGTPPSQIEQILPTAGKSANVKQSVSASFSIVLLFFSLAVCAQTTFTVTGTVTDDRGAPLPAASVRVKNGTTGISTDSSGAFSLNVPNGNVTVVFSSVGYAQQEFAIKNRSNINVRLSATENLQNEVVVIGYGTQRKRDITGSVTSLSAEDIQAAYPLILHNLQHERHFY